MIKFLVILILMVNTLPVCGQNSASWDRYRAIKVFSDNKADVEKRLRKGSVGNNEAFVLYWDGDMAVSVSYSFGSCQSEFAEWNLPEWTVTEVTYTPQNEILKPNVLLAGRKKHFKRKQVGDVDTHIEYSNDNDGTSFLYDEYLKRVRSITVGPSLAQQKKFACPLKQAGLSQITDFFLSNQVRGRW